MRLIDADELKQKVIDYQGGAVDKTVAKRLIEQMPTIEPPTRCIATFEAGADKEEITRWVNEVLQNCIVLCVDCKHRGDDMCPMHFEELREWDDDGYLEHDVEVYDYSKDDGFCYMGERRSDES